MKVVVCESTADSESEAVGEDSIGGGVRLVSQPAVEGQSSQGVQISNLESCGGHNTTCRATRGLS